MDEEQPPRSESIKDLMADAQGTAALLQAAKVSLQRVAGLSVQEVSSISAALDEAFIRYPTKATTIANDLKTLAMNVFERSVAGFDDARKAKLIREYRGRVFGKEG